MKKCGCCGIEGYNIVEIFDIFQQDGIKTACPECAAILDRFAERVHVFAEKQAIKARRAMLKRLGKIECAKRERGIFFLLSQIRYVFKKRVIGEALKVCKPQVES